MFADRSCSGVGGRGLPMSQPVCADGAAATGPASGGTEDAWPAPGPELAGGDERSAIGAQFHMVLPFCVKSIAPDRLGGFNRHAADLENLVKRDWRGAAKLRRCDERAGKRRLPLVLTPDLLFPKVVPAPAAQY